VERLIAVFSIYFSACREFEEFVARCPAQEQTRSGFETFGDTEYRSDARTLDASFKITDKSSVEAGSLFQFSLGYAQLLFPNATHNLAESFFYPKPRLNLFAELRHAVNIVPACRT
jgi:hypothetical protein